MYLLHFQNIRGLGTGVHVPRRELRVRSADRRLVPRGGLGVLPGRQLGREGVLRAAAGAAGGPRPDPQPQVPRALLPHRQHLPAHHARHHHVLHLPGHTSDGRQDPVRSRRHSASVC